MHTSLEEFEGLLGDDEGGRLEFKTAEHRYDFEDLVKYCAALANEGGGKMIFGVTDKKPRTVTGSAAFQPVERTEAGLVERLRLRIEAQTLGIGGKRVLIFHVPSRPIGLPIQVKGRYLMRGGDSLVPMTPDKLKRIFDESGPDFTAELCDKATIEDLNPEAVERFRALWLAKSGQTRLGDLTATQLLEDAELLVDDRVTFAALILLGNRRALGRHLANAEVIYEFRSNETPGPANQRAEYCEGCLAFLNTIWDSINLRNDRQHFQQNLVMAEIPTFSERPVREAILNAVSHRDYRHNGSIFVRHFPRKLVIESPGGFPPGITPENILWKQLPRNRRLADAFAKCGLVERSGQGMDLMFERCIREGKALPDFARTDEYQVVLTFHGEVKDPRFIRFLEAVSRERPVTFKTEDLLVMDLVHREEAVPPALKENMDYLRSEGLIEMPRKGKFVLARRFYSAIGQKGVYTRKVGLDRETNKALLLKHIEDFRREGARLADLMQVLPAMSRGQVQWLLRALKAEGKVHPIGPTRASKWFPGPAIGNADKQ